MIVGTLQYMTPEQLEGKDADARTDIFAFGAVLYEMVTNRKAFDGPWRRIWEAAFRLQRGPAVARTRGTGMGGKLKTLDPDRSSSGVRRHGDWRPNALEDHLIVISMMSDSVAFTR